MVVRVGGYDCTGRRVGRPVSEVDALAKHVPCTPHSVRQLRTPAYPLSARHYAHLTALRTPQY
eukprot:1953255-Rhodomonas_salina.1